MTCNKKRYQLLNLHFIRISYLTFRSHDFRSQAANYKPKLVFYYIPYPNPIVSVEQTHSQSKLIFCHTPYPSLLYPDPIASVSQTKPIPSPSLSSITYPNPTHCISDPNPFPTQYHCEVFYSYRILHKTKLTHSSAKLRNCISLSNF